MTPFFYRTESRPNSRSRYLWAFTYYVLFIVSATLRNAFAESLPQSITFQHLLENNDTTIGEVAAFLQDHQGFMWIGSGAGLIRYDGYNVKFVLKTIYKNNEKRDNTEEQPAKNINHISQDSQNILWVSTRTGLLRYDPRSELLTSIPDEPNTHPLSTANVQGAIELPSGELIAPSLSGLFVINRKTLHYTVIQPDNTKTNWLQGIFMRVAYIDPNGALWLGTDAGLEKLDWATKTFTLHKPYPERPDLLEANKVSDIVADTDGTLWLGTADGLVHYAPKTQQTTRYVNDPNDEHSFGGKQIAKLMLDSNGVLWVASDGGGLATFEKSTQYPQGRFTNHQWIPGQPNTLNSNVVRMVYQDRSGDVWVGNYPSGINFFDRSSEALTSYTGDGSALKSASQNSITAVIEDAAHNLWFGTDGGGLNYRNRKSNQVSAYKTQPGNNKSISGDSVLSIFIADDGKIWAGTWGAGVSILNPATGTFERMPFDMSRTETKSISTSKRLNSGTVWSIKQDQQKNIWLSTHNGGLSKYDPKTRSYTHYINKSDDPLSINSGVVWSTFEDSKGNFWVGTGGGLDLMDRNTGQFTHYKADPKDPASLSNPNAIAILEDSKQRLWIGTDTGLNLMNSDKKTFTTYNKSNGFNDDTIRAIVEDSDGQLWLTTNNGISIFNPETKKVKNINRDNGRLMGMFNANTGLRSHNNEIILGGDAGLRIFDSKKMQANNIIPPIAFTGFKIFTDDIKVGALDGILPQSINHTRTIVLNYKQSMIQFSFAALNFRDTKKNQYAYKLDGFDANWLHVGDQRSAVYTNLDSGTYVFHVKGSNNDGLWNNEGASITLIQLPPPWRTWWAYTTYFMLLVLMIVMFVRSQQKKVAYERMINLRMRNLDTLKENFLANTSHELRTPLNGIIGLAESICTSSTELPPDELKQKAKMILYSGKRLSNIVNDIMEFSQLANNELVLTLSNIPLRPLLAKVLAELNDHITDKSLIVLSNITDNTTVFSNEHRLTQILHHIIDNAIKFTREGSITIAYNRHGAFDTLSITDTGIGIAPENIDTIFGAFQQVDGSAKRATQGSGLGLSVIKKLVELHNGEIKVESVVDKGTTFHLWLPRSTADATELNSAANSDNKSSTSMLDNIVELKNYGAKPFPLVEKNHKVHTVYFNSQLYADEHAVPLLADSSKSYKILIVDDDPVNRMVIKAHLRKQNFATEEAIDGDDALKIILDKRDIDLVVLDVMMPRMTGYEACELLRKQYSLHKLPVIFLTANHQSTEIIKAFSVGGNDFLTKPVSGKTLGEKVKLHLSLLEESRRIDAIQVTHDRNHTDNTTATITENNFDISAQGYLPLQQAVANIVAQAYCLIAPVEIIGCWMHNDENHFACIENLPSLPPIAMHSPMSWKELEQLTDIVGKENKNISLARNLVDAARAGRLGQSFFNAKNLYCELIFRDNFIVGFMILSAGTEDFMTQEYHTLLAQCQTHIAAAVLKTKKISVRTHD